MNVFEAVKRKDLIALKECSDNGTINSQDKNGMTPFMVAIDNNEIELVKFILGLKINLNIIDKYGQTALMIAAGRGNALIVKEIIKYKPNMKIKAKSGGTAYDFAVENGYKEISELLG